MGRMRCCSVENVNKITRENRTEKVGLDTGGHTGNVFDNPLKESLAPRTIVSKKHFLSICTCIRQISDFKWGNLLRSLQFCCRTT